MLYAIVNPDLRYRLILIKLENKVLIQRIYIYKIIYFWLYISILLYIYSVIVFILMIINVKIEFDSKDLCTVTNEFYIILYQNNST